MQSSLAVIVFAYVRHVLFNGDALPIGAMLSGLQLTQISYLRSMELWGIALSGIRFRRKLSVMTVIVVAVLLASTVGPSSASLMIPNLNYWPAGSTHIWLNITPSRPVALQPGRLRCSSLLFASAQRQRRLPFQRMSCSIGLSLLGQRHPASFFPRPLLHVAIFRAIDRARLAAAVDHSASSL